MVLIDTHFHLDKYRDHRDLYKEINSLKQYTLCVTNSPGIYLSCQSTYPETKYVKFALGMHPLEISEPQRHIYEFDHCFSSAKYLGEVGLDYSKNAPPKEEQLMVFSHIIQKQAADNKLISIHIRGAEEDAIRILSEYTGQKRIIHWFTGSAENLVELVNLGCYFSLNTSMVRSVDRCDILKLIPLELILVESDGPYTKVGGHKYTPTLLKETYMVIGSAIGIQNLEGFVYRNFAQLL